MQSFRSLRLAAGFLWLLSCSQPTVATASDFRHSVAEGRLPWTHDSFDAAENKFTFAIFSDLTGGEREGIFEVAVAQLNLLRPEFIVNVGDLVDGSTDAEGMREQWDSFDRRARKTRAPLFYAGGNHDLTGEVSRAVWEERIGPRYYHFLYKDTLFLVLDTEDNTIERMRTIEQIRLDGIEVYKNEGPEAFAETAYANLPERESGRVGAEQAEYFRQVIADNPDVLWTFVFLHKPAWKREAEENFVTIEDALADRPYSVFYGHTHVFEYEERRGRDYINLATTGGAFFPDLGRSMDHLMLVTVDRSGATLANLHMKSIFDKRGLLPAGGEELEFEPTPEP